MFKLPNGFDIGPYIVLMFVAFMLYWFFPSNLAQRSPSLPQNQRTAAQPAVVVPVPVPAVPEAAQDVVPPPVPEVMPSLPVAPASLPEKRSEIQPGDHPRIAVVIDDLGLNAAATRAALALPSEVALAFLPYGPGSAALARAAQAQGHEVLLHLPMQPVGRESPGPDALTTDLSDAELAARVRRAFAAVPGTVGVNNHMGSLFTVDAVRLVPVMREIKSHGGFFLDSKTTPHSKALAAAHQQGIPVLGRDVFLDDVVTEAEVRRALDQVEAVAVERSSAIAIGHPHSVTLTVLLPWLRQLAQRGFTLVPLTALLPKV